jgi:hypothetical protein
MHPTIWGISKKVKIGNASFKKLKEYALWNTGVFQQHTQEFF